MVQRVGGVFRELRRQWLRLLLLWLLGLFPGHPAHDQRADCHRARQAMGGSVLVDNGEEFNRETDFGCS
jgi:hypothetical protein